jgi:predicted Ser/Thr protein kinase
VLPPELVRDESRRRRFVHEARAASAVNHPAIAQIYEIDTDDDITFIVMEYVDGSTVRELLNRGELDVPAAIEVGIQVADALGSAHEAGIVHRDIKSDNIMVTKDGHPKILDFGLAKLLDLATNDEDPEATKLETLAVTQAGMVLGTVAYMSPEQARGMPADKRSDIFSFGVVLYEMATGKLPFQGKSALDTMHAIAFGVTQPLSTLRVGLPFSLQRVVDKCLQKEPDNRYQDMRQVAAELKTVRREIETGVTGGQPFVDRVRGWSRGLTAKGTIWVAIAGFAVGGLVVAILTRSENKFGAFFALVFFGSLFYRRFRNRRQSAISRFAKRAGKLPEVRMVTCHGSQFTVVVERPTAKTYLKLNGFLASANGHLFHGEPFTMSVRESVSAEERRSMLTSAGLQYASDDL